MLATVEMIREKYGGADGYLRAKCGFGDDDISRIRANILDRVKKSKLNGIGPKSEL